MRQQALRDGKQRAEWVQLPNLGRQGVAHLLRIPPAAGRSPSEDGPGFNPSAQPDADLFKSLMDGEHCLRDNCHHAMGTSLVLRDHHFPNV